MFALFDDCWNPEGYLGKQPDPVPGVHNSRWVRSPGEKETTDETGFESLHQYFLDVIGRFKDDDRVYLWDIYNEPGNSNFVDKSLPLLQNSFQWAREANPS